AAPMIYTVNGQRQLIIWHAQAVNGLDPETGKVYWSEPAVTYQGMSIATPRASGDMLYITAYPSVAMMLKLDPGSASVKWKGDKKNAFYTVFSSPHFENGYVYGVNSMGILTCIKADT